MAKEETAKKTFFVACRIIETINKQYYNNKNADFPTSYKAAHTRKINEKEEYWAICCATERLIQIYI